MKMKISNELHYLIRLCKQDKKRKIEKVPTSNYIHLR